jgi:hypothetical protein
MHLTSKISFKKILNKKSESKHGEQNKLEDWFRAIPFFVVLLANGAELVACQCNPFGTHAVNKVSN